MRSEKQFAILLAMALGLGTFPALARQHTSAPQRSEAPRQSAPAPRTPRQETRSQHSYAPAPQRSVARPPQNYRAQSAPRTTVPRPPQNARSAGTVGAVQRSPQVQGNNVPRPPQANTGQPTVGNAQHSVPRPPVIGTPRDVHQGPHAGDWLRRYNSWPPQQRQHALESDPAFKRLPQDQQQRYRNQLNQFSSKAPQDQQRVINRMDAWGHLSQAQKDQARNTYGQLKTMPADRQQQVNSAYKRLRGMPPSAREQVMNSPEFQSRYNEQERNVIKNMTDINNSLPHD